jgi:hypothetical protein
VCFLRARSASKFRHMLALRAQLSDELAYQGRRK